MWHGKGRPGPPRDPSGHGERFPSPFSARLEVGEWSAEPSGLGDGGWLVRGCPLPHFFLGYGRGWRRNAPPSGEDPARGEGLVEAVRIGAVSGRFWLTHGRKEGRHGQWHPARRASPRCPRAEGAVSRAFPLADNTICKFSAKTRFFFLFPKREKKKKILDFSLQRAKIFALAPRHVCESRSPRALRCSWSPPTAPAPRWEASLWLLSP